MSDQSDNSVSLADLDAAEAERAKYDRPIEATIQGALRGASFGLSDAAQVAAGTRTAEELKAIKEESPTLSTAGEIGGIVAPLLLSGGTSAVGSAARVASAPVRGVSALGALGENAVAKSLANVAAQSTAKNILAKAAAKGVGAAIEGAMYGVGNVVSETALGNHEDIAARLFANAGGSALLSGGIGASLPIIGFGVKSAINASKKFLPDIPQVLSGLSKESQDILKDNVKFEKLKKLESYGDSVDSVIANKSEELASVANEASSSAFDTTYKAMKDQESKIGGLKADVDAVPLLNTIDEAIKRGGLEGRKVTPQAQKVYDDLVSLKKSIQGTITDNLGLEVGSEVPRELQKITPSDALKMWRQYSDSANYASKLAESPYMNQVYKRLASTTDEAISALPDGGEWKAIKTDLRDVLNARKDLKNYGFNEAFGIDTAKFSRIPAANDSKWLEINKSLSKLDGKWGTNLSDEFSQLRAYKEIYPKDALSRFQTGRAGLIPDLASGGGAAVGAFFGGPVGAAVGYGVGKGLGAVAQSPAFMRNVVRGSSILSDAISSKIINPVEATIAKNALVADSLIPWASSKAVAFANIDRNARSADSKINSGVNSFFKTEAEPSDEPITSSLGAFRDTNFGKTRVAPIEDREEAFRKRLDELTDIVSNPDKLTALMSKNLEQLSLVAPQISNALTMQMMASTGYLYNKLPKPSESDPLQPAATKWKPSDAQLADAERLLQIYDNPLSIMKDLKDGTMTMQHVEDMRAMHPIIYKKIAEKMQESALKAPEKLSYSDRLRMSKFLGVPLTKEASPKMFKSLQSNFAQSEPVRPSNRGRLNLDTQTANERVIAR